MSSVGPADRVLNLEEEDLFARDIDGQLLRLDAVTAADLDKDVTIKIDGRDVTVKKAVPLTDPQGNIRRDSEGRPIPRPTTIYDAASELFVKTAGHRNPIPILCHQEHLNPVAVCRICVVEIAKVKRGKVTRDRKLLPACQHRVEETMEIQTIDSPDLEARERVRSSVRVLAELLVADHLPGGPANSAPYNELAQIAKRLQVDGSRFKPRAIDRGRDDSSNLIVVDHNQCVLCDRCVRACDDVKKNLVIGRTGKGYTTRIGFDLDQAMGESTCVSCGECMVSCPTGALTLVPKHHGDTRTKAPGIVPVEELKQYPIFAGVPYKFLQWNAGSVVRRLVRPGEMLCREGEMGSTAFLLIEGEYEISIKAAVKELRNEATGGLRAFFGRIKTSLVSPTRTAGGAGETTPIRSDGGKPLTLGQRVGTRTPKDVILGEMTCLNYYPRSATVQAKEDGEVLEINRNVLYFLQRNKSSREILDRAYRERVLADHLRSGKLFAELDEQQRNECAEFLERKVELLRVDKGQVIFRQGDRADDFYTVRLGFVKATQSYVGQDRVLDYLGPGTTFGEIGLLSAMFDLGGEQIATGLPPGTRTATCTALDDVELVRIRGEHFAVLLERYPAARDKMIADAKSKLARDAQTLGDVDGSLGSFLEQGLFSAQKLLVLDLECCTRCDECTKACSDTHDDVTRLIREGLRFDKFLVASSCRSCLDPYCLVGCPVDSIHRRQRDKDQTSLEIFIEDWCIGCGQCARNCPYGNINMHETAEVRKATTCDLCRDVVGANEDPSCVYACPHNAAFRMSGPQLRDLVEGRNG